MKKLILLFLLMLSTGIFVGCVNKEDDNRERQDIEHVKGTAKVPVDVKKAAVYDLGILDIIDSLEIEDVELALPTASYPEYLKKFEGRMVVGTVKEPDLEALFNFEPDVIFISTRMESFYSELNKIAPTIYLDIDSSKYISDLTRNVSVIAKVFNKTDIVNEKIQEVNQLIDSVKEITSTKTDKALIVLTNAGTFNVYGAGSRFGLIHDVLGIKQADTKIEISTHGQSVSGEYFNSVNPDIIFVIDRTSVVEGNNGSDVLNTYIKDTNAFKSNKVILLDQQVWYLVSGGLQSTKLMINEIFNAVK